MLQVDLAQHEYLLPRLAGQWSHLERLGGGIGTRGPGETQLETDRRLVRDRIGRLKRDLEAVRAHRSRHRNRRQAAQTPLVSLVGYTNAGKSTLFNALVRAGVLAEAKPFSTLDPITRRMALPDGTLALLTDTVGFIHKLPHTLVAAFARRWRSWRRPTCCCMSSTSATTTPPSTCRSWRTRSPSSSCMTSRGCWC